MKRIVFSRDALKSLRRMPADISERIRSKVRQYAAEPESLAANVKALKGKPEYFRLRVGDWRIIFSEDAGVVAVIRIVPRGNVYD